MTKRQALRIQAYRNLFKSKYYYLSLALIIIFVVFYIGQTSNNAEKYQRNEAYSVIGTVNPLIEEKLFADEESNTVTLRMAESVYDYLETVFSKNDKIQSAWLIIEEHGKCYTYSSTGDVREVTNEGIRTSLISFISYYDEGFNMYVTKPYYKDSVKCKAVFIPVLNDGEKTNAYFGATYTYKDWVEHSRYHTILAIMASIILFFAHFYFSLNYYHSKLLFVSEEQREKSKKIFKGVFEQNPIGISLGKDDDYLYDNEGKPYINPAFEKISGRSIEELSHTVWRDITYPDDIEKDAALLEKFKKGEITGYEIEKRYMDKEGKAKWAEMRLSKLNLGDEGFYNICMIRDIDEKKKTENALNELMRSRTALLDNLPGAAYRCKFDEDWTMIFISEGVFGITGYMPSSIIENGELSYNDIIAPEYRDYVRRRIIEDVAQGKRYQMTYEIIDKYGVRKWVWEQGSAIKDDGGSIIALEGIIMDITENVNKELELAYLNMHDILTGLYNKETFIREFTQDVHAMEKWEGALLILEVSENMVKTMFTYGKEQVENALINMGKAMTNALKPGEDLFTIERGLYLVYIKGDYSKKRLSSLANEMIEIAKRAMAPHNILPVCGILEGNKIMHDKLSGEEVLKLVQLPLRFSNRKESEVIYYSNYMIFHQARKDKILEVLRETITSDNGSLKIVFQPIIDVKENRTVSFEALSRIVSEQLGIISPNEFIPIAEETGDIIQLGRLVLINAITFIKELEQKGFSDVYVSVNVSPLELIQHNYVHNLKEIFETYDFDPKRVSIEITETAIPGGDLESFNNLLDGIKKLGIKIAIDDFGIGFSTLSRTRELSVDFLKIDRYFISKLDYLKEENAITQDVISLAHRIGHKVVAEGVETETQLKFLTDHGCDYIQGFYIAKPMSKQDAIKYLYDEREKKKNEKV